jgi:hypothetical protein
MNADRPAGILPTLKVVVWRLIVGASESVSCPSSVIASSVEVDAVALLSESESLRVDPLLSASLRLLLLTADVVVPSDTSVTVAITPLASAEPSFLIRILKSFGEPASRF